MAACTEIPDEVQPVLKIQAKYSQNPCASSRSVYLSGGLKPATETSRILFYPPLVEAGVFPTEIKYQES